MHKRILHIALPSIASNITVPLLGLVDIGLTGHLGATAYIGAMAVGTSAFSLIYWLFGFLRMGTGGLTSQAFGSQHPKEVQTILLRGLLVAGLCAMGLLVGQTFIADLAFALFNSGAQVDTLARSYFSWLIWGAPAILGQYVLTGWFLGQQNAKQPLWVAIVQNVVNIPTSLFLVVVLGWKMTGVAMGTLIAQYAGLALSLFFLFHHYKAHHWRVAWQEVVLRRALLRFLNVNRNIFLRTLCLLAVTTYFTRLGAAQGEEILAVNALLMQFYLMASYVLDGFAYAGEALGGSAIGADNRLALWHTVRAVFLYAGGLAVGFTLIYTLAAPFFLAVLTDDMAVRMAAIPYVPYAIALPLVSFGAFVWDGFYIGATATRGMLMAMFVSSVAFFLLCHALLPLWGNHALWIAFLTFLALRTLLQTLLARSRWGIEATIKG